MKTDGRPWFWKDPRLSILLPFWKQIWGSVAYVVVIRDPSDIALSLQKRDGLSTLTSFLLWERYLSELVADGEIQPAACFVSYELLMEHPQEECGRLCRFLDGQLEIEPSHPDPANPEPRLEAMAAAVSPGLWRSRARPFQENPLATLAQKALHRATVDHSNRVRLEESGVPLRDPAWREHLALADRPSQTPGLDLCQVFWRNSSSGYEEQRSAKASTGAQGDLQSIQLSLPSGQVQDRIFLRVDFSQRPGFMKLKEMSIANPAGESVWNWDGQAESIQDLPHHQMAMHADPAPQHGCLLSFEGDDPWIEIELDLLQSAALANEGTLLVRCIYLSTERALLTFRQEIAAEIAVLHGELRRLRQQSSAGAEVPSAERGQVSQASPTPPAIDVRDLLEDAAHSSRP
jgi:hypothetical protein